MFCTHTHTHTHCMFQQEFPSHDQTSFDVEGSDKISIDLSPAGLKVRPKYDPRLGALGSKDGTESVKNACRTPVQVLQPSRHRYRSYIHDLSTHPTHL